METLDTAVLDELRGLGGDDLRDIVELYFSDVIAQIDNLHASIDAVDSEGVASGAHRIKGASLSMGAARLAALAAEMEVAGRAGDLSPCPQLLASLEAELEPTRTALGSELALSA